MGAKEKMTEITDKVCEARDRFEFVDSIVAETLQVQGFQQLQGKHSGAYNLLDRSLSELFNELDGHFCDCPCHVGGECNLITGCCGKSGKPNYYTVLSSLEGDKDDE